MSTRCIFVESKRHKWSLRRGKRVIYNIDKAALANIILYSLLVSPITFAFLSFNLVEAQEQSIQSLTSNNSVFSTYKNREYGFEISYPSQWQKTEFVEGIERNGRNIVTSFLSLPEGGPDKFRAYIMGEVSDFQPNHLLSEHIKQQIGDYEKLYPGFKLVESPSSISNIPSNRSDSKQSNILSESKIVFTYDDPAVGTVKVLEQYFQNKDHLYIWSLHSEATNYRTYLPIIQTMVDSFHIS